MQATISACLSRPIFEQSIPTGLPGGAAFDGCLTLAMSKWGTLYSVCGPLFGAQQLATIDLKRGHANLFGVPTAGLAVMSIAFGPDGKLYAVGDCNPDFSNPAVPACIQGSDPNFNSLYTIDVSTGAFSRIGARVDRPAGRSASA